MAIALGAKAPDFTLFDTDKKERKLSEFVGKKTVLVFFPGAFTGVCTKEMCTFRDSMTNFNNMNAQIVGISVDSPFANKGFATANQLTYPILSDYTRTVSREYVGLVDDFAGLKGYTSAKRGVVILDKAGVVKFVTVTDSPGVEPNYDEINKALATVNS